MPFVDSNTTDYIYNKLKLDLNSTEFFNKEFASYIDSFKLNCVSKFLKKELKKEVFLSSIKNPFEKNILDFYYDFESNSLYFINLDFYKNTFPVNHNSFEKYLLEILKAVNITNEKTLSIIWIWEESIKIKIKKIDLIEYSEKEFMISDFIKKESFDLILGSDMFKEKIDIFSFYSLEKNT